MKRLVFLAATSLLPLSLTASGLDLTLIYGTRYIALGGAQIAVVNDAYSPFYNPAGMTQVEKATFVFHSSNLLTQREAPISADYAQQESELNFGPLFYVGTVYKVMDRISVGFGLYPTALQGGRYSPVDFGAGTLAGRELSNRLVRLEFAPSIAFKATEHLSFGLSYRAGYTRYDSAAGSAGIHLTEEVTGWDISGLKAGVNWNNWKGFSAALTYRVETKTTLEGETEVDVGVLQTSLPTTHEVTIPAQMQLGFSYQWIPEKFLTAFCYEYTFNDVIKNDTATVTGLGTITGTGSDLVTLPLSYKNGHTFHLGSEYVFDLSNQNKIRTGVGLAFDKAVTREGKPHPLIAPANHYIGYALGAQYEMAKSTYGLSMNYGQYSHNTDSLDAGVASSKGEYALTAYLVSLDYQYRF